MWLTQTHLEDTWRERRRDLEKETQRIHLAAQVAAAQREVKAARKAPLRDLWRDWMCWWVTARPLQWQRVVARPGTHTNSSCT
jgi:hypothetical protein